MILRKYHTPSDYKTPSFMQKKLLQDSNRFRYKIGYYHWNSS